MRKSAFIGGELISRVQSQFGEKIGGLVDESFS
jgi:hypothetical protein